MRPSRHRKTPRSHARTVGIREIASSLGVSIGTVDRALHDRPGINAETRARVLATSRALGYRPNLAARFLSSRKTLRVGIALPREIASFWDLVRDGIEATTLGVEPATLTLVDRSYSRLGEGETEALEACLGEDLDGLLISPGDPVRLAPWIERAHAQGISVVCVDTDAPGTAHLTTVCVDPLAGGAMAADLMGRFLGGEGEVLVATGLLTTTSHARKVESFRRNLADHWSRLRLAAVVETHDDEAEAYEKCRRALATRACVRGAYVATANSLPVLKAVEDEGQSHEVTVITTDLFPDLCPHLESGRVAATLHQRPWTQGRIAFQALHRFLVEGKAPPPLVSLSPQIVMRGNLRLFREHLRSASGRGDAPPAGAPSSA